MRSFVAATIVLLGCHTADACTVASAAALKWEDQLAREPIIFIGTVLKADHSSVLFSVEEPIRGIVGSQTEVPQGHGVDCAIVFGQGARWIFAGRAVGGPSHQFGNPPSKEEKAEVEYVRSLAR